MTEAIQTKTEARTDTLDPRIFGSNIASLRISFGGLNNVIPDRHPETNQRFNDAPETKIESKKLGQQNKRRLGNKAMRKSIDELKVQMDTYEKNLLEGTMLIVPAKHSQEFNTNKFDDDATTGVTVIAKDKNGDRFIFNQEYKPGPNKLQGIKSLNESLSTKIPTSAEIERAIILTPGSEKKDSFSKDEQFLDLLLAVIDNNTVLRNKGQGQ